MNSTNDAPFALLLDDNLMSSVPVQAQLKHLNFQVHLARTVPAAMENEPQLIIINLGSRPLNGVALIGVCRERFPHARLIGFCGHVEVDIRRAAKAAGIDKLLTNEQALSELQTRIVK